MRILGLDIASQNTGWAVLDFPGNGPPSVKELGLIHHPKHWKIGRKLFDFYEELSSVIHKSQADHVVIEAPFIFRMTAVKALYKFHGVARLVVWEIKNTDLTEIPVSKIRSILGVAQKAKKGTSQKTAVRKLVNEKFGLSISETEEDISDAIAAAWAGFQFVKKAKK